MLNAEVVKRVAVSDELIIVYVRPDTGVPDFLAGQYIALGLPGSAFRPRHFPPEPEGRDAGRLIKRSYSICSTPAEKEHLEFYISIDPSGALTSRMFPLEEGDRLYAAPRAVGAFVVEEAPADSDLLLFGTGTGVAPFVSMLRSPTTWLPERKVTLVWGVRYAGDLAYGAEFEALAARNPRFKYIPLVSRNDQNWSGLRGRVQRVLLEKCVTPDPERDHVYVAGNPGMIDELEKLLGASGYRQHARHKPGNLHLERYW